MKKFLALALAVVMVFALCACGSEPAPAAAPADTTVNNGEAEGAGLVYWSMWEATEPQGVVLQEAIDAFTAETGVKVDVQFKGRQGIRQGLQAALDAGTEIDLFDEGVDRVNLTWGNYILDLEKYMANGYEDTAVPAFMATCREMGGGTLKSIPYQGSVFAVFYNPDIFAEAGVTELPTTWEQFLDVCQKIKDAGYAPLTSDDAYITSNWGYHLGRYIGEEGVLDVTMNGNWDRPEVLQAAKDMQEMAEKGFFSENMSSNVWPNGQNVEFALGDVAMYLNGSWLPNEIRGLAPSDDYVWGCFSYPSVPGGKDDTSYVNTSFQVFAINKESKNPDVAFQLIEWLTKGEWDLKLSQGSLGVPADTSNTEWPAQMANVKPVLDGTKNRYQWAVGCENNTDIYPVLLENYQRLVGGMITAEEFVANMLAAAGK